MIRRLGAADAAVLERACQILDDTAPTDVQAFLARPEAVVFLAEDSDDVVGWIYGHELVHPDGERTMLLYALDVVESARRRGWGTRLTRAFVDYASALGCTEVWVLTDETNDAARATYGAAGATRDAGNPVMFSWPFTS